MKRNGKNIGLMKRKEGKVTVDFNDRKELKEERVLVIDNIRILKREVKSLNGK